VADDPGRQFTEASRVSDTDSFIEEVSEEVRNDRMFAMLKKWGWLAGLAVLGVVGAAGYNEYAKSSREAAAQELGDAFISAFDADDPRAAFGAIETSTPEQGALAGLMAGADALSVGDTDAGLRALDGVSNGEDVPPVYRELAALKRAMALPKTVAAEDRMAAFEALAAPGAPFRVLAQEQKALVMVEQGDAEGAIALLKSVLQEAGVTAGLQQRAAELIVALGGDPTNG
jgi:hypothetical protein